MKLRNWLFVAFAFVLTACGPSMYVRDMEDSKSAMVFGYIHASEGPMYFQWVQLRRIDAAGNEEYYTSRSNEEGLFYAENLPPGRYEIHRMGRDCMPLGANAVSNGGGRGGVVWSLGAGSKSTAMVVRRPGLNYLGSFKFTFVEGKGFFSSDSFTFDRAGTPLEKEVLKRLLPYTQDTRWEGNIKKRIAEL